MQKILIFSDWYLPAYKAGGPVRSISNLVSLLQGSAELFILTSDRDLGDAQPFEDVSLDVWIDLKPQTKLCYISIENQNYEYLKSKILEVNPDVVYLNSMYSKVFSLYPLWFLLKNNDECRWILCPRGMLKPSALANKAQKKKLFLNAIKLLGISKKLQFHATDTTERKEIIHCFGNKSQVQVIPNVPSLSSFIPIEKQKDQLKILFVGRIHPIKNLLFALECIAQTQTTIEFNIIGNMEDEAYWNTCKKRIDTLPERFQIKYLGAQTNDVILQKMKENHLFFLPTKGENFGHAIFEAFGAGRAVLISDQTPWRNLLAKGAGWDLPLNDTKSFVNVLEIVARMEQNEYDKMCQNAYNLANDYLDSHNFKKLYSGLFGL